MAEYVDHAEITVGQIATIAISVLTLLQQQPLRRSRLAVAFLLSATSRAISPLDPAYRLIVQPLGLMRSDYRLETIPPHKFGPLIGALTIILAIALVTFGYPLAGWGVVAVLLLLTAIAYAGWCVGCYLATNYNVWGWVDSCAIHSKTSPYFPTCAQGATTGGGAP